MQRTPIYEAEREAGATFGDVDGWEMPKVFASVRRECLAARRAVAVADRSHFGRLRISGERGVDLLHRITTNRVEDLEAGQGAETILCAGDGGIVDRLILYADEDHCLLVTSPGMARPVREAIEKAGSGGDVSVEDLTAATAMIALVGPASGRLLGEASGTSVESLPLHGWKRVQVGGHAVVAARTHGIAGGGFDLIVDADGGGAVWTKLLGDGAALGAEPAGAEAMEILRIESGVPALGRELTGEFGPLEARLDAAVRRDDGMSPGTEEAGRPASLRKAERLLVGFLVEEGSVPEPRSRVYDGSEEVGVITSVAPSLEMRRVLALGYVRAGHEAAGTRVRIRSAGGVIAAEIASLPFVSAGPPA